MKKSHTQLLRRATTCLILSGLSHTVVFAQSGELAGAANQPDQRVEVNAVSTPTDYGYATTAELLQQRYPDGKVQIERYVAEDNEGNLVFNGPYKEFSPSGTLVRSGSFSMGKKEGVWTQNISASQLQALTITVDPGFKAPFKSEANFIADELHGDWTIFDSAGNLVLVWQFDMGKRHGISTWFNSRHQPTREITYVANVPSGPAAELREGKPEPRRLDYEEGRIVHTKVSWYSPGKKRSEETLLVPAGRQIVSHDWWNTTVTSENVPGESMRHGAFVAWYPDGKKMIEGSFQKGEAMGEFKWWHPNGQELAAGVFENDKRIGHWTWWYADGFKKFEGNYDYGIQVGQWSKWNPNGKIALRGDAVKFADQSDELELDLAFETATVTATPQPEKSEVAPAQVKTEPAVKAPYQSLIFGRQQSLNIEPAPKADATSTDSASLKSLNSPGQRQPLR